MKAKLLLFSLLCLLCLGPALIAGPEAALAQEQPKIIKLPEAVKTGGLPLLEALAQRKSERNLADTALTENELSNLLWAATGVNRPDGRWTVPTARNRREVSVYLITWAGVYRYLPDGHALEEISVGDRRKALNIKGALKLIVVLDETHAVAKGAVAMENASVSAGAIAQNVYLYCASANLGAVVKKTFATERLTDILRLSQTQKIVIIQQVGHIN